MEQLFLVARPKGRVKKLAAEIRQQLNEKFKIYGEFNPTLHVTVEVVKINEPKDLLKAKDIIKNIAKQFSPFPLQVTGFAFFPPPFKAITLAIEKNNEIEIISKLIHEALAEQGMIGREDFKSWKFHITVASPFGAERIWTAEEFNAACEIAANIEVKGKCLIDKLELWRPVFDLRKMQEGTFPLKNSSIL